MPEIKWDENPRSGSDKLRLKSSLDSETKERCPEGGLTTLRPLKINPVRSANLKKTSALGVFSSLSYLNFRIPLYPGPYGCCLSVFPTKRNALSCCDRAGQHGVMLGFVKALKSVKNTVIKVSSQPSNLLSIPKRVEETSNE